MYSFCPHCGQSIGQDQKEGQLLVCRHCGRPIGVVAAAPRPVVVDQSERPIQQGTAARCPVCQQIVELKTAGSGRILVPHYGKSEPRRICPGSGKPAAADPPAQPAPAPRTTPGKDIAALRTKDHVRVVSCRRDGAPLIEELTLEYLDKADRVRVQIDALRDVLGPGFRMKAYPPTLNRPQLAVWGSDAAFVIGKRHDQGGYLSLGDAEILAVLDDVNRARPLFLQ